MPPAGGAARSLSNIDTGGGDITVAGRDVNNYDRRLPAIGAEVSISAPELIRLDLRHNSMDAWIDERGRFLRETLIPKRPLPIERRGEGVGPVWRAMGPLWPESDYDADLAEFDDRLRQHLALCRARLPSNAAAQFYERARNTVVFTVHNSEDETLEAVELIARFDGSGLKCTDYTPSAKRMPESPAWPTFEDKILSNRAFPHAELMETYAAPLVARGHSVVKISRDPQGLITAQFALGHIGPRMASTSPPVTLLLGPNFAAPNQIQFDVVAFARNRRQRIERRLEAPVGSRIWRLGDAVDPHY